MNCGTHLADLIQHGFAEVCLHIPALIRVGKRLGTTYIKTYTPRICAHLEWNSLNVRRYEKCFKQEFQMKMGHG
jgi:hypothetical protein